MHRLAINGERRKKGFMTAFDTTVGEVSGWTLRAARARPKCYQTPETLARRLFTVTPSGARLTLTLMSNKETRKPKSNVTARGLVLL